MLTVRRSDPLTGALEQDEFHLLFDGCGYRELRALIAPNAGGDIENTNDDILALGAALSADEGVAVLGDGGVEAAVVLDLTLLGLFLLLHSSSSLERF